MITTGLAETFGAGVVTSEQTCYACQRKFECRTMRLTDGRVFPLFEHCETCGGNGIASKPEPPPEPQKLDYMQLKEKWKSICPAAFREVELSSLPVGLQKVVEEFDYAGTKGLFLQGGTGTHKSRTSYYVMKILFCLGKRIRIFSPSEFLNSHAESFNEFGHAKWFRNIAQADVVLFDDLGQEKFSERAGSDFFGIVSARMDNNRMTLYNSNFDSRYLLEQLPAKNAPQILRRIVDSTTVIRTGPASLGSKLNF